MSPVYFTTWAEHGPHIELYNRVDNSFNPGSESNSGTLKLVSEVAQIRLPEYLLDNHHKHKRVNKEKELLFSKDCWPGVGGPKKGRSVVEIRYNGR